ncbi:MAG: hypothetical protein COA57_02520 [Flavobacteriales bacterium]|nr:MAG: hypothetical protein COA57_02520 [Flavobacteriales bacterium]
MLLKKLIKIFFVDLTFPFFQMRFILFIFAIISSAVLTANAPLIEAEPGGGVIVLEGNYHNKNLYVQNDVSATGVGYCTYEVRVNGNVSTDEIHTSAFEIDLAQYNLPVGAPVTIIIKHKTNGCAPKVLNPEVLKPNPTFETTYINVNDKGLLKWTTVNETSKLPFVIEQFKWNKWVKVGEVQGKGIPTTNFYSFKTDPIAGMNKLRVKQKGYIDKVRYTPSVSYNSLKSEISHLYIKKYNRLEFSEETSYEVYDKYGNLVKKGYGSKIEASNLKKDIYYVNYGNNMAEFKKK